MDDIETTINFSLGKNQTVDDIVTRLQFVAHIHEGRVKHECIAEAADEIERLRNLLDRAYVLAIGHGFNSAVWESIEDALDAYEGLRRG